MPLLGEVLLKKIFKNLKEEYVAKSYSKQSWGSMVGAVDIELAEKKREIFDGLLDEANAFIDGMASLQDKVKKEKKQPRASRRGRATDDDGEDATEDQSLSLIDMKREWKAQLDEMLSKTRKSCDTLTANATGSEKGNHKYYLTKCAHLLDYCLDLMFDYKFRKEGDEDTELTIFFLPYDEAALRSTFGKTLPQQQNYVRVLIGTILHGACLYHVNRSFSQNYGDSGLDMIKSSPLNPTREVAQDKLRVVTPGVITGLLAKMALYNNQSSTFEQINFLRDVLTVMKEGSSDSTDVREAHPATFSMGFFMNTLKVAGTAIWGKGELDLYCDKWKAELMTHIEELREEQRNAMSL